MSIDSWNAELALDRAALWRLAAALLRYPNRHGLAELRSEPMWARALDAAQRFEGASLREAILTAHETLNASTDDALEYSHGCCFGHTVRGPVPAYESEWGKADGLLQPHRIADLSAFYRAHGLVLSPGAERADHVSVQAEFLHFLACKAARATLGGDGPLVEACEESTCKLLSDHLAQFAPAFTRRLASIGDSGIYRHAGQVLRALIEIECRSRDIATGDDALPLRTVSFAEDAACVSCALRPSAAEANGEDHGEN
ncbi:MAG: molecular chaperone TorD family protein [Planctomycetes bacterium]|nr:molecular chaperone TorD family protein [Planctomycetota bacterium]